MVKQALIALSAALTLIACGSGGDSFSAAPMTAPPSKSDAQRLLLQASFGADEASLKSLENQSISAWVHAQLQLGSAYDSSVDGWLTHLERTVEIAKMAEPSVDWDSDGVFNRQEATPRVLDYQMAAWLDNALGATAVGRRQIGSDPLRQRVAYALSQILVVSNSVVTLNQRGESLAAYYDLLARNAFGNFRNLLGDVARSPTMGVYLSHQGNAKTHPTAETRPDENFARELMQLFTIGLYELNIDGSPNRDDNPASYPDSGANLVPSYSQADVEEMAKIMTGWDLRENKSYGNETQRQGDYTQPMEFTAAQHEDEVAEGGDGVVSVIGRLIPLNAGSDGSGLDAALDVLFEHPNMAPFLSRQLIMRLVSSNPSSGYLARVSRIFEDNGKGQRGDLSAVVAAVLLDPEAHNSSNVSYAGKLKEPMLAMLQLLKAAHVEPLSDWQSGAGAPMSDVYWYRRPQDDLGQAPLRSPSVFNFYTPDHKPEQGTFSNPSAVSPEAKLITGQMLVASTNRFYSLMESHEKNKITTRDGKTLAEYAASINGRGRVILLTNFDRELALFEQALDGDRNAILRTWKVNKKMTMGTPQSNVQ